MYLQIGKQKYDARDLPAKRALSASDLLKVHYLYINHHRSPGNYFHVKFQLHQFSSLKIFQADLKSNINDKTLKEESISAIAIQISMLMGTPYRHPVCYGYSSVYPCRKLTKPLFLITNYFC